MEHKDWGVLDDKVLDRRRSRDDERDLEDTHTDAMGEAMAPIRLQGKEGEKITVRRYGAHVTSFVVKGREALFVSERAVFQPPKAIRGGVPICFPQFSDLGSVPQSHGFARNATWKLVKMQGDRAILSLKHEDVQEWQEAYPHQWEVVLEVSVGKERGKMCMKVRVTNRGEENMPFTFAFHTYLRVDACCARVENLKGLEYWDNTKNRETKVDQENHISPYSEVDRVYLNAPDNIRVVENSTGREIIVRKRNLPSVVVWNPWQKKAVALPDMGDLEYRGMICVEPAIVEPIQLKPGETWEAEQSVEIRMFEPGKAPAL